MLHEPVPVCAGVPGTCYRDMWLELELLCAAKKPCADVHGCMRGRPEDFRGMLIGVMDIVFTFGGQVNWMRYIISMRTPSKFPLAVAAVSGVMTTAYVAIGSIGCALAPRTPAPVRIGHALFGAPWAPAEAYAACL